MLTLYRYEGKTEEEAINSCLEDLKLEKEDLYFKSYTDCARFISEKYNRKYDAMRDRLRKHRTHIFDYDVIYLNAETIHDDSTE